MANVALAEPQFDLFLTSDLIRDILGSIQPGEFRRLEIP